MRLSGSHEIPSSSEAFRKLVETPCGTATYAPHDACVSWCFGQGACVQCPHDQHSAVVQNKEVVENVFRIQ